MRVLCEGGETVDGEVVVSCAVPLDEATRCFEDCDYGGLQLYAVVRRSNNGCESLRIDW